MTPPEEVPDETFLDGRDPALIARWNRLEDREEAALEAIRRGLPPAADDFVRLPLPRVAAGAGGGAAIAGAVREYKKEAKVVDTRLFRTVTLQMKGAPLADFCARIEDLTGVRFRAARNVADEKVTLFVKDQRARDAMRAVARLFGYFWSRSGEPGAYRYELLQDLKSRLAEEELRNRDANAALFALDERMQKFRPYLEMSQEQLDKLLRDNLEVRRLIAGAMPLGGWAGALIYPRLTPAERAALAAGQEIVFRPDASDPDRRMPPEWQRRILEAWASGVDIDGQYRLMNDVPGIRVTQARLRLDRSELGQVSLAVRATARWPGRFSDSVAGHEHPIATGRSPSAATPANATTNAALRGRSPFDQVISLRPETSCVTLKAAQSRPLVLPPYGIHSPSIGDLNQPHVCTADVWEALYRETGLPIVADSDTRMHRLDQVIVSRKSLFGALCTAADAMGVRWSKDGDFLLCRSTSYLWDKLKEVPERHLRRWLANRDANRGLPFDDFLEMASMPDSQSDSAMVAEAISHCRGLPEWGTLSHPYIRQKARFLATLAPEQLRRALTPEAVPFQELTAEQQQGVMELEARVWR
jgi:hypothetical protein